MADQSDIPLLDHELADDELSWAHGIYKDFSTARSNFSGPPSDFNPKETLRDILGRPEHRLPTPIDLAGDGVWRGGKNKHGRYAACVFLKKVELHRHAKSRTDQFPMYVIGEAQGFSLDDRARPILTDVTGGDHFHNSPNAPHAFVPKVGKPAGEDWEIAFIAITPRNLRDDTQAVYDQTRADYKTVVGADAPVGV